MGTSKENLDDKIMVSDTDNKNNADNLPTNFKLGLDVLVNNVKSSKDANLSSNSKPKNRALRRIRIGDKLEEIYNWPLSDFEDLDSPCALQEYLQDSLRSSENFDPLKLPENQAVDIWLYEHLRQVCLELSYLVVQLMSECNAETCKDMKANEWFYLCASHATPRAVGIIIGNPFIKFLLEKCCAIDYITHTLDGATQLLNSPKFFPSRISVPSSSIKHFASIARRLYRIFAHSFYHHRSIFDTFEHQHKLYGRFLQLVTKYSLVPEPLITIPDLVSTNDYLNVNTNPRLNFANPTSSETEADEDLENENETSISDEASHFVPLVRPAHSNRSSRR